MSSKRVLVVPLNWGLGHATRLIPIIKMLLDKGIEVKVAGSPSHVSIFKKEFDNIEVLHIPWLNIKLNNSKSQIFSVFFQLPVFIFQIIQEHRQLKKLLNKHPLDIVISDNCYGLWNPKVHSIFITHQLSIKLPKKIRFLEKPINLINHWFINKYNSCWVPDFENDAALAGELSIPVKLKTNLFYIGPLSRFYSSVHPTSENQKIKNNQILFIISGPETQRTLFETLIKKQIDILDKEYTCIVFRGLPEVKINFHSEGWFNYVSGEMMQKYILESEYIVCRPGYSTIMDLAALQKKAIVIPTPGQTEQEYLAGFLESKGFFYRQDQDKMNIAEGIKYLKSQIKDLIIPAYHPEILEDILERMPFK
jgi:uncharacterized protein (TIGR00661 family)